MPYPFEPRSGDPGLVLGGAMIPTSVPASYIPSKGEPGFSDGKLFMPLEPLYHPAYQDDFPLVRVTQPINRRFPWIEQTSMAVATPCIAPYDWSLPTASRTLILDTTPDEIATDEEKAVPGYVPNPGLRFASQTQADFDTETATAAINIDSGKTYRIVAVGDTDFVTEFGASANTVGIEFVATADGAPTSGTGTTVHLAGAYNDKDGVAFIYKHAPDCAAGSFVVDGVYRILFVGTTNFTAIGASENTVGATFTATGVGSGTGRAQVVTPAPAVRAHPLLRTGSARYVPNPYPVVTKVGTEWDGKATLPQTNPVNGVVNVCAYRYGLLLSTNADWPVLVKIGKAKVDWSKSAKTLTLSSTTPGVAFKYSLDGSAPTTLYTAPIDVADTATVRWQAEHNFMVTSNEWSTYVEYQDATPPDDFETFYFSTLPAIGADQNTTIDAALLFQRHPDWYVSPAGVGDGLTPSAPSNATSVIGLSTATGAAVGKALGIRSIAMSVSGAYTANTNGKFEFITSGAMPYGGGVVKYCTGAYTGGEISASFNTYSAPVTIDAPGRVYFKLVTSTGDKRSRVFMQPWFMGPANINAVWDSLTSTVALTYEPTPVEAEDVSFLYSIDGSAPSLPYFAPVVLGAEVVTAGAFVVGDRYKIRLAGDTDFRLVGAADNDPGTIFVASGVGAGTGDAHDISDVEFKAQAIHSPRETRDFATQSGVVTLPDISPETTADFDEDKAIHLYATPGTITHKQPADLVWASEGTYSTGSFAVPSASVGVTVKGGYNTAFTERDIVGRPSIFTGKATTSSGAPAILANCVCDGLHFQPHSVLSGGDAYVCSIPAGYCCHSLLALTGFERAALTVGSQTFGSVDISMIGDKASAGTASQAYLTLNNLHGLTAALTVIAGEGGLNTGYNGFDAYARINTNAFSECTVTVQVTTGDSGVGADRYSGSGFTYTDFSVGSVVDSTLTVNVVGGKAPVSGGGAYDFGYARTQGGFGVTTVRRSTITADVYIGGTGSLFWLGSAGCVAGCGAGYLHKSEVTYSVYAGDARSGNISQCGVGSGYDFKADLTATVGSGGGEPSAVNTAYCQLNPLPSYFDMADVSIYEGSPLLNGNPARPNEIGSGSSYSFDRSAPWFSGNASAAWGPNPAYSEAPRPGGNGAPLKGFGTPGSGVNGGADGVALGRYWE